MNRQTDALFRSESRPEARLARLGPRRPLRAGLLLVLLASAWMGAGCSGPVALLPGGRLRGETGAPLVADWSFAEGQKTLAIETCPSDPHSVQTWFASIDARLYVPTSMIFGTKDPSKRRWVRCIEADPRVRVRIGETVFERRAVRVEDPAEYAEARAAIEARHGLEEADRDPERTVWIYRLTARRAP